MADSGETDWKAVKPTGVDHEDTMNSAKVKKVWTEIYKLAGLKNPDETTQRAMRMAVYVYGCLNGTSREGNYNGEMRLSNGTAVPASVIPRATGKMQIRQFYRGNMNESYEALKQSGVIEEDERFVAKVAQLGISASCAFATSDWMGDCPLFTPAETAAYNASFNVGLQRSRRARDGKTLEGVEQSRTEERLDAQGPSEGPAPVGRSVW